MSISTPHGALVLAVLVMVCGCASGTHEGLAAICTAGEVAPTGQYIRDLEVASRARLEAAGLSACGAAEYCGEIDDVTVRVRLRTPGERDCPFELNLTADLSGLRSSVESEERPLIAFRDGERAWLEQYLVNSPPGGDVVMSVRTTGTWLAAE